MGVVVKKRYSREYQVVFSAYGVVTPKFPGERGLELICTVVGEAGRKLQFSR